MQNKKSHDYFFFIFKDRYNRISPDTIRTIPMKLEYGMSKNVYLSFKKRKDKPAVSKIAQSTITIIAITNFKGGILTKTNCFALINFWETTIIVQNKE